MEPDFGHGGTVSSLWSSDEAGVGGLVASLFLLVFVAVGVATGAVAVVEHAVGGVPGLRGDEGLFKRRFAHVVESAGLVELPLGVSHIPLAGELDEYPFAGKLVGGTAKLGDETVAVGDGFSI